jgi:hypothetical protein
MTIYLTAGSQIIRGFFKSSKGQMGIPTVKLHHYAMSMKDGKSRDRCPSDCLNIILQGVLLRVAMPV